MSSISYIAVHGGAGSHGTTSEKEIKQALRKACADGLSVFRNAIVSSSSLSSSNPQRAGIDASGSAARPTVTDSSNSSSASLTMVAQAIAVLEDDGILNAGYGSNLTLDGTVECDAAIMNGRDASFGSVGAVSGVKNPIYLARSILEYALLPRQFGRVPPLTLASTGAHAFATTHASASDDASLTGRGNEVKTVPPEALIAPSAFKQWRKWKTRLESAMIASEGNAVGMDGEDDEEKGEGESMNDIQDTVGAVAYHPTEGVAAGVSSGGLLLKWPGRIGEAGIFGAGCWANQSGVACSISGTGEHIIRENLARKLGDAFDPNADNDAHEILNRVLQEFWRTCQSRGEEEPAVGVLLLTCERGSSARLWCAFTTASMAIGYASSEDARPKAVILRHPNPGRKEGAAQIYITSIGLQGV